MAKLRVTVTKILRQTGDDWPQIERIENIVLKQSSQDLRDLWSHGRTGLGKDFYF